MLHALICDLGSVNVVEGEPSDREMTTGRHTVRDIYCVKCNKVLGWKYVSMPFLLPPPAILMHGF